MKEVDRIGQFMHFNRDRPAYQPIDRRTDMASYRIVKARLQRDNLHLSHCIIERFFCVLSLLQLQYRNQRTGDKEGSHISLITRIWDLKFFCGVHL